MHGHVKWQKCIEKNRQTDKLMSTILIWIEKWCVRCGMYNIGYVKWVTALSLREIELVDFVSFVFAFLLFQTSTESQIHKFTVHYRTNSNDDPF